VGVVAVDLAGALGGEMDEVEGRVDLRAQDVELSDEDASGAGPRTGTTDVARAWSVMLLG